MKAFKYITYLFLGLFIVALASCSEDKSDEYFDPITPEISIDQKEVKIGKAGGEFNIDVKSNLPWRAEAKATWITLKNKNGSGNDVVKAEVALNRTLDERSTEIHIWINDEVLRIMTVIQEPSAAGDLVQHYYVKASGQVNTDGLSWATATTMDNALEKAMRGDFIHVAAGTYSPTRTITNGKADDVKDKTFEIHSNFTIIGGYPAEAKDGDEPDAKANETILSGVITGGKAYHVVAITAPIEKEQKVSLQGLSIKNGEAAISGTGSVAVNGATYYRFYGGGMLIGKSVVEMTNCIVSDNSSGLHAGGMYIFEGAHVTMEKCIIENNAGNTGSSNAGGIFVDASTLYLKNSAVLNNSTTGVGGGIYSFNASKPTYTYIYNSLIAGNNNNRLGTNATRKGGGFYGRENSVTVMVNTTVYGNFAGVGAGVSLHGPSGSEAKLDMISCTIAENEGWKDNAAFEGHANSMINFLNCVISGNKSTVEGKGPATYKNTIFGSSVYGADGTIISGLSFDPKTMIAPLADNGGDTKTSLLIGTANPAKDNGMTSENLEALGQGMTPIIESSIITKDQIGLSRSGKNIMGACVK